MRRSFYNWMGIAGVLHILAAIFSLGFYHFDEHFQTLEFLSLRLGKTTATELPWEYSHEMRAWIQPILYEAIARGMRWSGILNPMDWALSFRLLSAALGFISLWMIALCIPKWTQSEKTERWCLRLLALCWFVPYLHARTSSESISGSLFFIGLALFILKPARVFWVGVLLGLAFQFRYQTAVMSVGFLAWIILLKHPRRKMGDLIGAFALTLGGGIILDRIGYGHWTFTPWNYLYYNLVQGQSSEFGVEKWYYYFTELTRVPPLGALVGLSTVIFWIRRPKHILTWTTLPLFLVHTAIAHKELRFLFPLASALPIMIVLGWDGLLPHLTSVWRFAQIGLCLLIPIDVIALVISTMKPSYAPVKFYNYIYSHHVWESPIHELYYSGDDPYTIIRLKTSFYKPESLKTVRFDHFDEIRSTLDSKGSLWLFYAQPELPPEAGTLAPLCKMEYTAFPRSLNFLNVFPGIQRFACRWSLFRCDASTIGTH